MAERRRVDGGRARRGALAALAVALLVATSAAGVAVRRDESSVTSPSVEPPTTQPPSTSTSTSTAPSPAPEGVVSVYGDSLVWEARHALEPMLRTLGPTNITSWGGTALCDYTRQIVDDARVEPTRLVVIGFTGNALTPCMKTLGTSPSRDLVTAMYSADLNTVVGQLDALGVPVLLIGGPPSVDPAGATFWTPINDAWADAAARWSALGADVVYTDTGLALTNGGRWAATLPCLPWEGSDQGCVDGRITVRAPDTLHFCPQLEAARDGVIPECAVWNSGAWRYARSISAAVEDRLSR
jgi:hypothetical protein